MIARARHAVVVLILGIAAPSLGAQVTETPIAFDSAGKILALTPALVSRYALTAPAWPVRGDFTEARLYAISGGGRVLVVERTDGSVERYPLTDDHVAALRFGIHEAMSRDGAAATEPGLTGVSPSARGAFIRNQMLLTWGLYGPLLASFANNGETGTAMYLLATGASYFLTQAIGRTTRITHTQNYLATDGALRGAATSTGVMYAITRNSDNSDAYAAVALAGALAGTAFGFQHGKRLTASEAESAVAFSNYGALAAFGVGGATESLGNEDASQAIVGAIVGTGLVGYALGPMYARRSGYVVTRGDVQMLHPGAILGAMAAVTPFVNRDDAKLAFGAATGGMVAGLLIADRIWVRPYDHSTGDAGQVWLGTFAGGLMGTAVAILAANPSPTTTMALVTGGGILGTLAGHAFASPPRAGARSGSLRDGRRFGSRIQFDPAGALLSAGNVRGQHSLLRVTF